MLKNSLGSSIIVSAIFICADDDMMVTHSIIGADNMEVADNFDVAKQIAKPSRKTAGRFFLSNTLDRWLAT